MDISIPTGSEGSLRPRVTQCSFSHSKDFGEKSLTKSLDDLCGWVLFHAADMTNYLSTIKTNDHPFRQIPCPGIIAHMELEHKPFGDIAARIRWHRSLEGLTQKAYAEKIGQKRAALNNWESGDYRLSLDGALAIRKIYGLSLDFMYEGIDDALPMTLRAAWRDKS